MNSEYDRELQANALHLLRREFDQLEAEVYQKKKQLLAAKERLEKVTSHLHLTQQQVDLFKHETQAASEKIKDANWHFTKEVCAELCKQANPPQALIDLSEKFMLLLDQKDRSFNTFKVPSTQAILKNFGPLKALMNSISADHLTEEQLTELLPVWKNQHLLQASLQRTARGAAIISEWISHCVEYKLKKETLTSAQKSLPDLENKVKKCVTAIGEKSNEVAALEQHLAKLHAKMDSQGGFGELEEKASLAELSVSSLRSTAVVPKSRNEEGPAVEPNVRFVPQSPPSHRKGEFPNFSSDKLYLETPVEEQGDEFQVEFGETSEYCGGCKGKYFCI